MVTEQELNHEKAIETAVYLSDEFDILPELTLNAGLRYSWFALFGDKLVYLYEDDDTQTPASVVDSLTFGSGEIVKSYGCIEPRISFNWEASQGYSMKLSYQRTRQYIHQISNNAVVSPAETWKSSDYYLEPLINDQVAVGIQKDNINGKYNLSSEIYYKKLKNLIEYKNGAQIIKNQHLETDLIPSDGFSYGAELSLNKKEGRLTGWFNYTLSRIFS